MEKYIDLLYEIIWDERTMKSDGEEIPLVPQSDFKIGMKVDFVGPGAERILQEMKKDGIDEISIPYKNGIFKVKAGKGKVHLECYAKEKEF